MRLTAQLPILVAAWERIRHGKPPIAPSPRLNLAGNFLYMMSGKKPTPLAAKTFDTALILHADHEFNASTFAARVTAATLSDLHSAAVSGIGALKGPLHGGANEEAMKMFLEVKSPERAEPWVKERAGWRMELFADLRITDRWSCNYEMTPDDHPIVGAVPGTPGLYIAAGFSGHGFMHTPATAQLIVEEMLDGKATTLDISDLSIERFRTGRKPFTATVL